MMIIQAFKKILPMPGDEPGIFKFFIYYISQAAP